MATKNVTNRNYKRKVSKSIADIDTKRILKDLDKPFSVLVGLAAGVPIAILVEKAVGKKSTVSGLLGIDGTKLTKLLKPTVNIALGMTLHQLARNPKVKLAGIGLAANGGLIAVKDFFGKDILKGIDTSMEETPSPSVKIIERVMERQPTHPLNLPLLDIEEPASSAYIDGLLENTSSPARYESIPKPIKRDVEEIILSSDRPEDNYEIEPKQTDIVEVEITGSPEEANPVGSTKRQNYVSTRNELDEELDFSDIP